MTDNTDTNKEKKTTTHKIGIYLWIWGLLFVLSFFSLFISVLSVIFYLTKDRKKQK